MVFGLALAGWEYENLITPMGVPLVFTVTLFLAQMLYGFFIESRSLRSLTLQYRCQCLHRQSTYRLQHPYCPWTSGPLGSSCPPRSASYRTQRSPRLC